MAFFDKRELVDLIRHEIRIEDETGIASRVIRPTTKRSKCGGLPLNFRVSVSDDEEEELDDFYTIPLYEETSSTRDLIESRLRSRTVRSDCHKNRGTIPTAFDSSTTLFVARPLPTKVEPVESLISRNIDSSLAQLQSPLNEFAIFEATDGPCKKILILFTNDEREEILRLEVSVQPTIRVFQLISFCHYKYFRATGTELPGSTCDYELFMADEDEPVDTEFPEIDRSRLLTELDFPCLALVRKDIHDEEDAVVRTITLYIPKGPSYVVHVPNPDVPFSWLIEEVLKRRDERGENNDAIVQTREYNLEPVDQFDLTMDLSKPISSTSCNEFVMIRKNSSRAGFHPRPERLPRLDRLASLMMSPVNVMTPMTPGLQNTRESRMFDFPEEFSCSPPIREDGEREMVSCFRVDRLHKIKPKWSANLIFYWDELEISPFASSTERRKSFLPQQYQKAVKVSWDHVVDVKMSEKERPNKETAHILVLTWLPLAVGLDTKGETYLPNIIQDYVNVNWKTIVLECKSREDAAEITKTTLQMLQMRPSAPQQAWKFSQEGLKRPSAAAEVAMTALQLSEVPKDSSTMPNGETAGKKRGKFRQFARLSRLLLSTDRRSSVVSDRSNPTTPLN